MGSQTLLRLCRKKQKLRKLHACLSCCCCYSETVVLADLADVRKFAGQQQARLLHNVESVLNHGLSTLHAVNSPGGRLLKSAVKDEGAAGHLLSAERGQDSQKSMQKW